MPEFTCAAEKNINENKKTSFQTLLRVLQNNYIIKKKDSKKF